MGSVPKGGVGLQPEPEPESRQQGREEEGGRELAGDTGYGRQRRKGKGREKRL